MIIRTILSACPGDINRIDNTCQVINGSMTGPGDQGEGMRSAGLVASGNILSIGAIIVMASLLHGFKLFIYNCYMDTYTVAIIATSLLM